MLDFFSAKDIKDKSKKSSLGQVWNFRHTFQTCHGENKMYENKIQVLSKRKMFYLFKDVFSSNNFSSFDDVID